MNAKTAKHCRRIVKQKGQDFRDARYQHESKSFSPHAISPLVLVVDCGRAFYKRVKARF